MKNIRLAMLVTLLILSAQAASAQFGDMAVIKGRQGCGGLPERSIHIDNEDTNNANSRSGWLGGITSDRNTTFRFCVVNSYDFEPAPEPYMLLSLTGYCPGGTKVQRYIDCENSDPRCNSNIPGVIYNSNKDVVMTFCLFSGGSTWYFPYYGLEYGVFAPPTFSGAIQVGRVYMDDQQASVFGENRNYWCDDIDSIYDKYGFLCSNYSDDRNYYNILDGGHNTGFSVVRVR